MNKDVAATIREAKRQGFDVNLNGGGHVTYRNPDGRVAYSSSSPSSVNAVKKFGTRLRKAGLEDNPFDATRGQRMAKGGAVTNSASVLAVLQERAGVAIDAGYIARRSHLKLKQVYASLQWLKANHPEVDSPNRGLYRWNASGSELLPEPEPDGMPGVRDIAVQVWCSCGETFTSPHGHDQHAALGLAGDHEMRWSAPTPTVPAHRDPVVVKEPPVEESVQQVPMGGHAEALSQLKALKAEPTPTIVRAPGPAVSVVPSVMPDGLPTMFEVMAANRKGYPMLRDEFGDWWLAVPLKAEL